MQILAFLSDADKFVLFFISNEYVFNIVAKICHDVLIKRNSCYIISYCVNNVRQAQPV